METKRVQLDLSEQEHAEMERLMLHAGLKTKREFVCNAITLFGWADKEILKGHRIGAISSDGRMVKELAMPSLTPFASIADELARLRPSREEIFARIARGGRPAEEVLADMARYVEGPPDESKGSDRVGASR